MGKEGKRMRKERIKAIIFSVCLIFGVLGLVIFKSDQLGFLLSLIFIILGVVNGKNIYEEIGDLIRDIKKNNRSKNVHKEIEKNFEEGQQCLMENQPNRAVECFGLVIQIGTEEEEFRQYAIDALDLLATLYDTGRVKQSVVEVNKQKAVSYYEQLVQFSDKPVYYEKLGDIQMDWQNYSKALDFYREAADFGSQYAMERLAHIYEDGITKQDPVTFMTQKVLPCNLNIALEWYRKLDNKGNPVGKSGINRIEAMLSNKDYLEKRALEEQLESIARQRELDKVKTCYNVEPITQFTYELKENKVDNYVMQFPIGFKEFFDEEIDQPYFSKAGEENAYRLYVDYVCVPSESPRTIESYLLYQNDYCIDPTSIKPYVTQYMDGIFASYVGEEKQEVLTFAFAKQNRYVGVKCVSYNKAAANTFREVTYTVVNSICCLPIEENQPDSNNRIEKQYYNDAVYFYNIGDIPLALEYAKTGKQLGSTDCSSLIMEIYCDTDTSYHDFNMAVKYGGELFAVEPSAMLAFQLGSIYETQLHNLERAKEWYEKAHELGHDAAAFYLGRCYYYGLGKNMRDGKKALTYFKEAMANGVKDAAIYIEDIERIGNQDLQEYISELERVTFEENNKDTAYQIARYKKNQIFYLADEGEVEEAYMLAIRLKSAEAAYELATDYKNRENASMQELDKAKKLIVTAYDLGYQDLSQTELYDIMVEKEKAGIPDSGRKEFYKKLAMQGYMPAIEKLIKDSGQLTDELMEIYKTVVDKVKAGNKDALKVMRCFERTYPELVKKEENHFLQKNRISNSYFSIEVPPYYPVEKSEEGGIIKLPDYQVEFFVSEPPIEIKSEDDLVKVFGMMTELGKSDEHFERIIINGSLFGVSMITQEDSKYLLQLLFMGEKNQYMFKTESKDKTFLEKARTEIREIAETIQETGTAYMGNGEKVGTGIQTY